MFFQLMRILDGSYWIPYYWLYMISAMTSTLLLFNSKFIELHWKAVTAFRFLYPARKLMFFINILAYLPRIPEFKWYSYIDIILCFIYAFLIKDNFGDDPRDKKKSRVLEKIKSLGHRLVVEPA